ncbi:MAG: 4-alpha-glucanotransferase, partial [Candidatus Acidiferrum sp.]
MTNFSAWGINESYRDDYGKWRSVSEATKNTFLAAMEATAGEPPDPALMIVRQGSEHRIAAGSEVKLEDGKRMAVGARLPPEMPLGYHWIVNSDGRETRLIVAPAKCFLPADLHTWGWGLQLYALRSRDSWGIGDLEDLRRMAKWSADLGAGVVMVNPLCATAPLLPQQASPYYPSSRLHLNPLYLRIENIAGAKGAIPNLENFSARGRALNDLPLIERDAIFRLKMSALETMWEEVRGIVSLEEFQKNRGPSLHLFAVFCVLAEQHGANWRAWPAEFQRPDNPAIAGLADKFADRVRFH